MVPIAVIRTELFPADKNREGDLVRKVEGNIDGANIGEVDSFIEGGKVGIIVEFDGEKACADGGEESLGLPVSNTEGVEDGR